MTLGGQGGRKELRALEERLKCDLNILHEKFKIKM